MSKKKKIIISVIAAVLIIAVIVSAVVIAMTKGKNAAKASGVYANKVADVMYRREVLTGTAVSWKQPIPWISRLTVKKR